jgi:hypothetical protein
MSFDNTHSFWKWLRIGEYPKPNLNDPILHPLWHKMTKQEQIDLEDGLSYPELEED